MSVTGLPPNAVIDPRLRDRAPVFRDRPHAGRALAALLAPEPLAGALVLAIPAGGVPVAAALACALGLPLDLAVTSKITMPDDTEAGYGAVAFDGAVVLNQRLLAFLALPAEVIEAGARVARAKVRRRLERLRGDRPFPELAGRAAVLVDDGLASGITMEAAVAALRRSGADQVLVAVPTGHEEAVRRLSGVADRVFCSNLRSGRVFAVADAYERWHDVSEEEVLAALDGLRG